MYYEFRMGDMPLFSRPAENSEKPTTPLKKNTRYSFQVGEELYPLHYNDQQADIQKLVDLLLKENPTSLKEFNSATKKLLARRDTAF